MKRFFLLLTLTAQAIMMSAQNAQEVLNVTRLANDYFMEKYDDPTLPTNVRKIRPSHLWTRAVYYEGLMALQEVDPQQRYLDYTDRWATFHQWTPRNGVNTCDADDQCCAQTYLIRYFSTKNEQMLLPARQNLDHQMLTANKKNGSIYGWWTWIDAIQMAMPLYIQMYHITGNKAYRDHAMKMYRWSRNECGGGLYNKRDGLWWRDADFVPPYKEPDGKDCYWSRGNGWVYAALVRSMNELSPRDKAYKELKRDFMAMSKALKKCQREDGFWNPSLVSSNYAMPETSGTALFLYGICWGMQQGYLKEKDYAAIAHNAWKAIASVVHKNGFLGWMQGTGKEPADGQPLSFDREPDFEDYGTGCFLLGATEYYKWISIKKD